MKFFYLLFFLACFSLEAQIVTIPDANFKTALIDAGVDTNMDGEIQVSEAEAVIELDVAAKNIGSLEGIQSFINLIVLECNANDLSALDVTQNIELEVLICTGNPITSLDVTQNTNLVELSCSNDLTSLDVTQNLNLEILRCGGNQLTSLDVSQNINLVTLFCYLNQLTELDLSQNPNLYHLWSYNNPLNNLDVTQNPNLGRLWCSDNQLTSLDLTQNPNLESLLCTNNQLSSLDLSQNLELSILACSRNQLSSLDLSNNIVFAYLECLDNQLTSLRLDNGNNTNMLTMISLNNPNLNCIQVDDSGAAYPECGGFPLEGWCIDEWSFYSEKCNFGLGDLENINISIYPVPVNDKLNISLPISPILSAIIYDLTGKRVRQLSSDGDGIEEIDVSELETGTYFLKLKSAGGQAIKRFVKK